MPVEPLERDDPRQIGKYRLQGRLGAGGMGRVFLGRSPGGREVAVKVVRAEFARDPEFRKRFAREVNAAKKVGGHWTAPVVDADLDAMPPWMATSYIKGPSLSKAVKEGGPMSAGAVCVMGAALAEGLAAIHDCGLVHRDLKPDNIIMSTDGPRILDFGIAHLLDASTLTNTGMAIGTPSYMSPEQIKGEAVGPGSDVFALGSVLTCAATGHPPFEAPSNYALERNIAMALPDLRGISGVLLEVITVCLARRSANRPDARDLIGRLAKAAATADAPDRARDANRPQAGTPTRPKKAAAAPPASPGGQRTAVTRAKATAPGKPANARGRENSTISIGCYALEGQEDIATVAAIACSPDGRLLAVTGSFSGGRPPGVRFWDVATKRADNPPTTGGKAKALDHPSAALFFAPGGRFLACQPGLMAPYLWDMTTRQLARLTADGEAPAPTRLTFSPNGRLLAAIHADQRLRLWDAATGQPLGGPLLTSTKNVMPVISPNSRILSFPDSTGHLRLWSVASHRSPQRLPVDSPAESTRIAFSPDSSRIATARKGESYNAKPIIFNLASSRWEGGQLGGPEFPVNLLRFSPTGTVLAAADAGYHSSPGETALAFWDLTEAWPVARTVPGMTGVAKKIAFSPDGTLLAVLAGSRDDAKPDGGARDQVLHLWDITRDRQAADPIKCRTSGRAAALKFSPDGRFLATGSPSQSVTLYDTTTRKPMELPRETTGTDPVLAFSADGNGLVTAAPGALHLWNLDTL